MIIGAILTIVILFLYLGALTNKTFRNFNIVVGLIIGFFYMQYNIEESNSWKRVKFEDIELRNMYAPRDSTSLDMKYDVKNNSKHPITAIVFKFKLHNELGEIIEEDTVETTPFVPPGQTRHEFKRYAFWLPSNYDEKKHYLEISVVKIKANKGNT